MSRHVICHAHCPGGRGGLLGLLVAGAIVAGIAGAIGRYEAAILGVLGSLTMLVGLMAGAAVLGTLVLIGWATWTRRRDDARELEARAQLGLPPYDRQRIGPPTPQLPAIEATPAVLRVVASRVAGGPVRHAVGRLAPRDRSEVQR